MRFPSVVTLANRTREVLLRFPWTMGAGVLAAVAAIIAVADSAAGEWVRVAMVAALGLPLTVALTLLAEEQGWSRARRSAALNAAGVALLILFYLVWPGPDRKHEAIRYLQLSAGLHLLVAFLPLAGQRETGAFWQYNRRLFLGILRAAVFSFVLFVGLAIALVALDKLFGVEVPEESYPRLWLMVAFVVNTAIFLAVVPRGLRGLAEDTDYPRVLKVFAQYILTPLVFIYLVMLLAYLVKIVFGGEWPSGWIGWLVTSVAVAGLLGFLLVHPLRDDAAETWIRTYTRWLFIGLIPAAIVLLVAFWKRILPYGLTELRLLGILLGVWLLAIAVSYTARQRAGIRWIPVTLAMLLLLTLYGPISVTRLSVASQGRRLKEMITAPREGQDNEREASAALRFLLDHGARREVAAAIPGELPRMDWDSVTNRSRDRDSTASRILSVAGMRYVPEYSQGRDGHLYLSARKGTATPISGYEWMLSVSSHNTAAVLVGTDSVRIDSDSSGVVRAAVGKDSLLFDLNPSQLALAVDSAFGSANVPAERLRFYVNTSTRRALLVLESMYGSRSGDFIRIRSWEGTLFVGKAK